MKTNEQVIKELNEVDELRAQLVSTYTWMPERAADVATEWAWGEINKAVTAEREACASLKPPPFSPQQWDEIEGAWIYERGGSYQDAFFAGWDAYRAAIRARGDTQDV